MLNTINLIREDLSTYNGDWTRPGLQALLVHRFGQRAKLIGPKLLRYPLVALSKVMFITVRNLYGIELPFSASIGRRVIFEHQHGIVVHGNCVIGDDCVIRQGVTLGIRRMSQLHMAPRLGKAVDVGAGAKILGGISVGNNVIVGANSVVLDNVPSESVAVGSPARVKRTYADLEAQNEGARLFLSSAPAAGWLD